MVNLAFGAQAWHRVIFWAIHKEDLQDLRLRQFEYYRLHDESTEECESSLKYLGLLKKIMKSFFGYLSIGGPFMLVSSLLNNWISGKFELPFQYTLPGLNSTDHPGFEINLLFQAVQTYCTCTMLVVNWFIYLFPIVSIIYQVDVIKIKLRKLDELINIPGEKNYSLQKEKLKEIFQLHITLNTFIEDTEDFNSQSILVDCFLYGFACVMVIFVEIIGFYGPGILILTINLGTIFVICVIGTTVQDQLETLQITIYNITWYEMAQSDKKTYLILLLKSINCERLTSGGLKPLNLELFIAVNF